MAKTVTGFKLVTDNSAKVKAELPTAVQRALEIIGGKAESYAKALCPVDTGALRNSITHRTNTDNVVIGSAVHYAPYVELGTGKEYDPPPDWIENNAERGSGVGHSQKPKPYLRPAIENHKDEYQTVLETELKKG